MREVLSVIGVVIIALTFVVWYLKRTYTKNGRTSKMARKKAANASAGTTSTAGAGTPGGTTTGTAAGAAASAAAPTATAEEKWYWEYSWTIVLVVAILVIYYFGIHTSSWESPKSAEMGSLIRDHWLSLAVIVGLVAIVVAINAKALGATTKVLWCVLVVLVVAAVIVAIVTGWNSPTSAKELPTLSMPADGDSPHINPPVGYAVTFRGSGFIAHCVYTDGHDSTECESGPMLYQYVHDTTGQVNTVTYEFIRPN